MAFSGTPRTNLHIAPVVSLNLALKGRRAVVVGGTDGIGRAFAGEMAAAGAEVTVVGRTFRDEGTPGLRFERADLSSMHEARRIGAALPAEVDLLILSAGIFSAPKRQETAEGLERDMAVSYLSRLALLAELAPRMATASQGRSTRPRIVVMGFPGTGEKGNLEDLNAEESYRALAVHMNTVAGNEALVLGFARRYPALKFYGLNPGLIKTSIRGNFLGEGSVKHRVVELFIGFLMPSAEDYARRMLGVLLSGDLEPQSPVLFNAKGVPIEPSAPLDAAYVAEYLRRSEALVARALAR